jgi:Fur family peroxide stress response transcriptional regulator
MQKEKHADKIREFLQICRSHHLKITPQRVAIYKELLKLDTHPTADAVYKMVKIEFPNISFDTVNRTLLTLADIGIVDIVEIFGGAKRFDPKVTTHHHLHCIRCGKVFDFYSRSYDNLKVPKEVDEQFQVLSKRVVLKGVCKACRN